MTQTGEDVPRDDADPLDGKRRPSPSLFGAVVRAFTQFWVVCLLLLAAAFGGVTANELLQKQARLAELREAPGPDAYAVVAYRRELERQVRAYSMNWRQDTAPMPPARPRLMEEVDLARPREPARARAGELAPISAPE